MPRQDIRSHPTMYDGGDMLLAFWRAEPRVRAAIATINDDAWTPVEYTDAVHDERAGRRNARAEVAAIPFTAFTFRNKAEQVAGQPVGSYNDEGY